MLKLEYRKLAADEIAGELDQLTGWSVEGNKLQRTWEFSTYKDGVVFASAIAFVADKLNHHPDITISYAKVSLSVNTHDVEGLSPYDFELARRIDSLSCE